MENNIQEALDAIRKAMTNPAGRHWLDVAEGILVLAISSPRPEAREEDIEAARKALASCMTFIARLPTGGEDVWLEAKTARDALSRLAASQPQAEEDWIRNAFSSIATGAIKGEPENYRDTVAVMRDIASEALSRLSAPKPEGQEALRAFMVDQIKWSSRTFGPSPRTEGILKHIAKELEEVRADPWDLSEWLDIVILGLDGYWRHGGLARTIMRDLNAKAAINRGRTYAVPASDDEPCEHIREPALAETNGE